MTTAAQVYAVFGRAVDELVHAEGFERRLRQMDQTIRLELREPTARITVRLDKAQPLKVEMGSSGLTADTVVRMSSETASKFLLGELNVFSAIDRGEMVVEGKVKEFLAIVPQMTLLASPLYRAMLDSDEKITLSDNGLRLDGALDPRREPELGAR